MFCKTQTFLSFFQNQTPNHQNKNKICAIFDWSVLIEEEKFLSLYAEITNNKTKTKEQKIEKTENR